VVNTANRGGSTLRKHFTLQTNDPVQSTFKLTVKGAVQAYIPMKPSRINLRGRAGEKLQTTVHIERLKAYPFRVKNVKAKDGSHLQLKLKEGDLGAGKDGYRLVVTNTMHTAGSYRDLITIETDSKIKPTLRIPVFARILAASK
jgi:hypothetical protein